MPIPNTIATFFIAVRLGLTVSRVGCVVLAVEQGPGHLPGHPRMQVLLRLLHVLLRHVPADGGQQGTSLDRRIFRIYRQNTP